MKPHLLAPLLIALLAGLGIALASCEAEVPPGNGGAEEEGATREGEDEAAEAESERKEGAVTEEADEGEVIRRPAQVENLELVLLKSFPLQVRATVQGILPDACTELDEVRQEREGSEIRVILTTRRPADALCAQVIGHFQETIPLEVHGLPAGTYEVVVNDLLRDSFTFEQDNILRPRT